MQIKDVGKGGYGQVLLAMDAVAQEHVALKFVPRGAQVRPLPGRLPCVAAPASRRTRLGADCIHSRLPPRPAAVHQQVRGAGGELAAQCLWAVRGCHGAMPLPLPIRNRCPACLPAPGVQIVNHIKLRHPHVIGLRDVFLTSTHLVRPRWGGGGGGGGGGGAAGRVGKLWVTGTTRSMLQKTCGSACRNHAFQACPTRRPAPGAGHGVCAWR